LERGFPVAPAVPRAAVPDNAARREEVAFAMMSNGDSFFGPSAFWDDTPSSGFEVLVGSKGSGVDLAALAFAGIVDVEPALGEIS
jgi:hypothetical protein